MQAVIPIMKQQGSGAIINVSSVAGHLPLPFHAIYSATKFAMNAIGKAARLELLNANIHVMTVCPGYVRTGFGENAVQGREVKRVRPSSVRGISAERVARATFAWLSEREEGSGGPLDDAPDDQALPAFSWDGGVGHGEEWRSRRKASSSPARPT